jgi:hypothetical protein
MTKRLSTSIIALAIVSFSAVARATLQTTAATYVATIGTYAAFGGGDVVFTTQSAATNCSGGFWLKKTDDGFQANLSLLVSAYHAQTKVSVTAYDNDLWPGSGSPFCHVYAVFTQ